MDKLEVLNAFRHQRENHGFLWWFPNFAHVTCSTPFGIRGKITVFVQ